MKRQVTSKQAARALGVSESSLKRWCDQGLIRSERTCGGHRRLCTTAVLDFIRSRNLRLVEPEILGLPCVTTTAEASLERAQDCFMKNLVAGNEDTCRRIVLDLYLAGRAIPQMLDEVVAAALDEIGSLWECGSIEVYEERRGCEIISRLLHELRAAIPKPPEDAPIAIGATVGADPYTLPTAMVELTLMNAGWNACSFGSAIPGESLCHAIERYRPALIWISASSVADEDQFVSDVNRLCERAHAVNAAIVAGGRALTSSIRKKINVCSCCETLQMLENFANVLKAKRPSSGTPAPD